MPTPIVITSDPLTINQKDWYAARMSEGVTGKIIIPSYLYVKFKKMDGFEFHPNYAIAQYLVDNCY